MNTNKFVYNKKDLLYICIALLLFFQIYLQDIIAPFRYLDELVAVICLFIIVKNGEVNRGNLQFIIIALLITLIGVIGNFVAGIQTGLIPILTDIGNSFKVFIVYLGAKNILAKNIDKQKIVSTLAFFVKCFVWIAFVFMVLHEVHIVSMGNDIRYGLRSFRFINHGAGQLSMMFYYVIFILTLDMSYKKMKITPSIVVALIVWCSTLRIRAFMYCLAYTFLYWVIIKQNKKIGLSLKTLIPLIGMLCLFGIEQFETYFLSDSTARANFLIYGIYTMFRYFPLGAGFATYGTDAAVKYYSKLYTEYGFESVYGLNRDNAIFSHDTYWPAIMAQFGIFGCVLMIVLIWKLCKDILKKANMNNYAHLLAVFIVFTQVSSSIATATFFSFVTVSLFFVVPLIFSQEE